MDETKREWVRSWLIKAHSDLRSARELSAVADPPTDTAIYHCQQAAEKAVKAYLANRDQPLQRTHDLETLLGLAAALEPGFATLQAAAEVLNPYSTAFRYPGFGDTLFPSAAELATALENADRMYQFALTCIPRECHPA